jgi:hypothetical protein
MLIHRYKIVYIKCSRIKKQSQDIFLLYSFYEVLPWRKKSRMFENSGRVNHKVLKNTKKKLISEPT